MPRKGTKRKRVASNRKMVRKPQQKKIPRSLKGYARIEGMYGRMNEIKFLDTNIQFNPDYTTSAQLVWKTTTVGSVNPTSGDSVLCIPQGTTQSTRIGRKIVVTEIDMKAYITGGNGSPYHIFFFAVVLDMQANGAMPTWTDIYTPLPTANEYTHNPFREMANTQRFKVLKQWRGTTNTGTLETGGAAYGIVKKSVKWFKKCRIPIEYSSTTGVISELKSNNIVLVGSCYPNTGVYFNGKCRIKYSDN